MKLFWTGTDVLVMYDMSRRRWRGRPFWYLFRIIVRYLDRKFVQSHLTNSQRLADELRELGMRKKIEIVPTPIKYGEKIPKIPHDGFVVLYYKPPRQERALRDWVYGIDLIDRLIIEMPHISFFCVDESYDMNTVYPLVDFYIRPNRHDGNSRMVRECIIQDIPYYWSDHDPDYDAMKKAINDEYDK